MERTCAVIVAIEEYPALGERWKLSGVAKQALEFTRWLIADQAMPKANIRAFVNGAATAEFIALGLAAGQISQPVSSEINPFLADLPAQWPNGESLVLYWVGHGFVDRDSVRRLILADAKSSLKTNLDVAQLTGVLRSPQSGKFVQQFAIFDACAQFFETLQSTTDLPPGGLNPGLPRANVKQSFFFAASSGQYGTNGVFGPLVLEQLKKWPWPPDQSHLWAAIEPAFDKLNQEGKPQQRPVWLAYATENQEIIRGVLPTTDTIREAARRANFPLYQLRALAETAAACMALSELPARDALVQQLDAPLNIYRPEESKRDLHLDLLRIIGGAIEQGKIAELAERIIEADQNSDAAVRFEQASKKVETLRGFWSLLESINLPLRQAQTLFRDSYRYADSEKPNSLDQLVQILLDLGSMEFLFEFLLRAARTRPRDPKCVVLEKWVESTATRSELESVQKRFSDEEASHRYLLAEVGERNGSPRVTRAWVWSSSTGSPQELKELAEQGDLATDVATLLCETSEGDAVLELLMPEQMLHLERGLLSFENRGVPTDPEVNHPVLLRWRERMAASARNFSYGKKTWNDAASKIEKWRSFSPPRAAWIEDGSDRAAFVKTTQNGEFIGFPFSSEGKRREDLLSVICNAGLPYACWPRSANCDLSEAKKTIREIMDTGFDKIPYVLRQYREKSDLLLLWDDPKRNPYDYKMTEVPQK